MKKVINTDKAPKAIGPYSQAIENNGTLFISGQIPVDPSTGKVADNIADQTRQVMENISAILTEAGYTFDNVVLCNCLLDNMDNFKAFPGRARTHRVRPPRGRALLLRRRHSGEGIPGESERLAERHRGHLRRKRPHLRPHAAPGSVPVPVQCPRLAETEARRPSPRVGRRPRDLRERRGIRGFLPLIP